MRIFGVIGALLPLLYCGGLFFYFVDFSGSVAQAQKDGLGPTLLGLASLGLLFCIPLILKILRIFAGPRPPGADGPDTPSIDVEAVIARYRKDQTSQPAPRPKPVAPPVGRPRFGRKTL